jgi:ATP-dependent DNA helicase RecG
VLTLLSYPAHSKNAFIALESRHVTEQFSFDLTLPEERLVQLWTPDEIYDRLSEHNLKQFLEDRRIERKNGSVQPKAMAEYLSMWSNTQPHGGIILVGIEDDGKITGCRNISIEHKNALESLSGLCPDARWACKEIGSRDYKGSDNFIMAYRVAYRADKLVETSSGEAFIREGDKKVRITETLKRELRISKGEIHYELEASTLRFPEDFDMNEIRKFCRAFYINRRLQTDKTLIQLLELARLGKIVDNRFNPNLACSLLFANDPRDVIPGARLRIIRYEGTEERFGSKLNAVFSTFVDGNIAKILFLAKPVILSQIRTFQKLTSSGRIHLRPEYPEEAWFEAVVNAVAHRSYNLKTQNIFVKIFDDRFVVESPGGFVPPTTGATVYDAHNPRNPYLMEAMMHLELTFCGFEGTRRMRQAMEDAKLPAPKFRQIEANSHQVHVTLENDVKSKEEFIPQELAADFTQEQLTDLTADESAIINYLTAKPDINITSAALVIGKTCPTASKVISHLAERKIIELVGQRGKKHDSNKKYTLKRTKT